MKLLILEDEQRIARYLEKLVQEILGSSLLQLQVCHTLEEGRTYLKQHQVDLLLLDLNLKGGKRI